MKAPAALPFYLYDFGAIRPDSFLQGDSFKLLEGVQTETVDMVLLTHHISSRRPSGTPSGTSRNITTLWPAPFGKQKEF